MKPVSKKRSSGAAVFRPAALAFAVAAACGVSYPQNPAAAARLEAHPSSRPPVTVVAGPAAQQATQRSGGVRAVINCDDAGAGSLRDAVESAVSGDAIDLTGLACSTITLTSGAIAVVADDLAITGPGADALAIESDGSDRVFTHEGAGTLSLSKVAVSGGAIDTTASGGDALGGCIASAGTVSLQHARVSGCEVYANDTAAGGCVEAQSFEASDSRIEGCTARLPDSSGGFASGGGVAVAYGGSVSILRSTIADNTAIAAYGGAHGGGAYLGGGGEATIESSTFSGNAAIGAPYAPGYGFFTQFQGMGGALFAVNPLTISSSTLSGNMATTGGAIAAFEYMSDATVHIVNSTLSGNTASGQGGALWSFWAGLRVDNSTLAFNHAEYGGGGIMPRSWAVIGYYDYAPVLNSTIVAGNTSFYGAADVETFLGKLTIGGSANLIGDSAIAVPADSLSGDPQLLPLADNGGPTWTHLPLAGSPVVDAGSNASGLDYEQRGEGFPRVVGMSADIGATEFTPVLDRIFQDGFD